MRSLMSDHASAILASYAKAATELMNRTVVLTDGKAGMVEGLWLDEVHGIRVSIRGHFGKWPTSGIKLTQSK